MTSDDAKRLTVPHASYWLALIAGVGLTLVTGVCYGVLSNRWGHSVDLVAAGKRLEEMPRQIGDWNLLEEMEMQAFAVKMLECEGYVLRQYVNSQTGEKVTLAVLVGPPGPIAVHTPEICYSSRAYSIESSKSLAEIDGRSSSTHTFWNMTFRSNRETADQLRVYYAWNAGDGWVASEAPRFEFAAKPMLYKLQLAVLIPFNVAADDSNAGEQFLRDLLHSHWDIPRT